MFRDKSLQCAKRYNRQASSHSNRPDTGPYKYPDILTGQQPARSSAVRYDFGVVQAPRYLIIRKRYSDVPGNSMELLQMTF
jgi:hypothetical protein